MTRHLGRDKVARMTKRLALLLALATACAARQLPGTNIDDTRDNRGVFEAIQQYVQAMDRRDAAAVVALAAPDYFDDAATPAPEDDVDRATLARTLPEDLAKVDAVKLEIQVRKIAVQGDRAIAEVFYDGWYRVKTANGVVPRRDSDVHQMHLRKVDGRWLFTRGL